MITARSPINARVRRIVAAAALLIGVITVFPLFAGTASAHHSEISADVVCDGTVSWTASSWSTGEQGTNPDIRVYLKVDNGATVEIATGAFNAANNYRFSGTLQWPTGANKITISSKPNADWANGNTSRDGQSITLNKPNSCPSNPAVERALECVAASPGIGSGTVKLTLTNNTLFGGSANFAVYAPDQTGAHTHYTVAAGGSQVLTFAGLNPDGPHYVKILVGTTDFTQTFSVDCDAPQPAVQQEATCSDGNGSVTFTLSNVGGEPATFFVTAPISLVVEEIVVAAGGSTTRSFTGLPDGPYTVTITANGQDLSQQFTVDCDRPGVGSIAVEQSCSNYDGRLLIHLIATGGELPVTFVVEGTTYMVAPNTITDVTLTGLTDGLHNIAVTAEALDLSFDVTVGCDPEFTAGALCNAVDTSGAVLTYWYTITNTETEALTVTWADGSTTVPAGGTATIGSTANTLSLRYGGVQVAKANASGTTCERDVTVSKELLGQPDTSETYTITVSRLVGADYVLVNTFDLAAGGSTTITLPSTLDPAGFTYKVAESVSGTAHTVTITPETFALSGMAGEAVSVVVTNGYAGVHIEKTTPTTTVDVNALVTYTLQATNLGGLTLSPVVILDRLPLDVTFVSATVEGSAGTCSLKQATQPQLVVCTMADPLAPAGVSPAITLTVKVDADAFELPLVNRAKVIGAYTDTDMDVLPVDMSCVPGLAGTVCDLSAEVTVTVTDVGSQSPGDLPATGGEPDQALAIALSFAAVGWALLVLRRRRTAR